MPDAIPLYDDANFVPCKASSAVTGRRLVKVSGNFDASGNIQVAHAGAGEDVFGVAQFDSNVNEDSYVTVCKGHGIIIEVDCGANLTAGQACQADAAGKAIPLAGGVRCGKAVSAGTSGATVFMEFKG